MYKLIVIDLDGTLLNTYGEITEENRKAIKKAKENGIEVVFASGRMTSSVSGFAYETGANNYIIAGNGALVVDLNSNQIVYDNCISKEKALKIIKVCDENNIYYTLNTEKYIISKKINNNLLYYYHENSKRPESKKTKINIVQETEKYVAESDIGKILKITISDEDKIIFYRIMEKLRIIKGITVLDVSNMSRKIITSGTEKIGISYFYTEITNEKVNKWNAVLKLAKKLNINQSEVVTIGDNNNDLEMIQNAGLGIIMGKSALSRKNLGKLMVSSCDESGVAEAIEYAISNG